MQIDYYDFKSEKVIIISLNLFNGCFRTLEIVLICSINILSLNLTNLIIIALSESNLINQIISSLCQ